MEIKSDIQIAQEAHLENIKDVAAKVGVTEDELEMYGKYKAKLSDELIWYKAVILIYISDILTSEL